MATDPSSSSRRLLRPLLPRLRPDQAVAPPDSDEPHPRRVNAACEPCRARKVKCDAGRPSCSKCGARRYECVYDTAPAERRSDALKRMLSDMESQRDAYKNLFDALQTKSEAEAAEIFRCVRRGADIAAIWRYVEDGDLLLQLRLGSGDADTPVTGLPALLDDDPYLAPCHAAEIVDPGFGFAKAAAWASVVDSYRFFVTLLKAYFQHQFCSPLLVNAVLAAACHGAPSRTVPTFGIRSLECRLLDELVVLSIANDPNGQEGCNVALLYSLAAVQLQPVYRFHVFKSPLIVSPPQAPLPDPETDEGWYGEIWLRYPGGQLLFPLDFGYSFEAACNFRLIINELGSSYFGVRGQLRKLSLSQALRFHNRMLQWYQGLRTQISPTNIIKYPHQLKIQSGEPRAIHVIATGHVH
ncbi:uncharacterized protein B0I36DRAFT_364166 [Microdochium trichocladiopsis]|uniref:Zn(2)-C6 fungal-type domain-containing protein n=1 Tax=Microdochium trichocladiopsis TaxID=1682393 RepID=A0A9P8Y371_9PEZI|nr:uncharacterized protein B0I36DRAFT_364166 [Microdochium trichocladiopsis]KAH7029654.1 hypothetical protein B0I36DRAFT_364166 [Microdochium trichocladiopsis]